MMAGWSPGRLSLAGRTPELLTVPPGAGLTPGENDAVAKARRIIDVMGALDVDGLSLSCVEGIDAAEAIRRLADTIVEHEDPESMVEDLWDDSTSDEALLVVGVTDAPGGCVVCQP